MKILTPAGQIRRAQWRRCLALAGEAGGPIDHQPVVDLASDLVTMHPRVMLAEICHEERRTAAITDRLNRRKTGLVVPGEPLSGSDLDFERVAVSRLVRLSSR